MTVRTISLHLCAVASQVRPWTDRLESSEQIRVVSSSVDLLRLDPGAKEFDLLIFLARRKQAPKEIGRFLESYPGVRVFALGPSDRLDLIGACLEAGACGGAAIGPDGDPPEDLEQALRDAARGGAGLAPLVADWAFRRVADLGGRRRKSRVHKPTKREVQILELAAQGLNNRRIAEVLGNSPRTVKNQLYEIYKILGVHRREDAVASARKLGWIHAGETS